MDTTSYKGVKPKKYELLKACYYGDGIFETGQGLIQYPRESFENYVNRQSLSYFLNYTAPIVNASVDPIFKDEIRREYKDNERIDLFLNDCDRLGTSLQDFIRQTATQAKLYGVMYVIVDNESDLAAQKIYNNKSRKLPFLTSVMPQDVVAWEHDNRGALTSFTYKTVYINSNGNLKEQLNTWTQTEFIVTEDNKIVKNGINPLGKVPVVQWFGVKVAKKTEMKPPSEFLSVAQANFYIYQVSSWHTQLLVSQAFNLLTMPSVGDEDITIGTANVLTFDPEAKHRPEYIAPDSAPSVMITQEIERVVDEMYRMSGINSVIGVKQSTSGVARQWEFERTNQRLADFAIQCENAEYGILKLYQEWTGEKLKYRCVYPRDFKIADISEGLANAQQVKDLGFTSKTFLVELMKKVIDIYMPEVTADVYDQIMAETEDMATQYAESIAQSVAYRSSVDEATEEVNEY